MKKSYRCIAPNGVKVVQSDRSFLSMAYNEVKYLKSADYDQYSSLAIMEATNHWSNAVSTAVVDEAQTSSTVRVVDTTYTILDVTGVWLATDTLHTGTNYFTGGSFSGTTITLGTPLSGATTNVIINYTGNHKAISTSGGAIAYTKTINSLLGGTENVYKVTLTALAAGAGGDLKAGTTITATFKNAAGSTLETRTRTLAADITAGNSSDFYFMASKSVLADSVIISGNLAQGAGTAYTATIEITPIAKVTTADGATITVGGDGNPNKTVSVQLLKSGVAITESNFVGVYLASDDLGLTPADATSYTVTTGATISQKLNTTLFGTNAVTSEAGIYAATIAHAANGTFYLVVQLNNGLRIVSDPLIFT